MVARRGDVWWAELRAPQGSEPGYRRPVIVVQSDDFNRSAIGTVLAVAVTSNLRLVEAPGNVRLSKRDTGLPRASVANVSQILTLDTRRLEERVGMLPGRVLDRVDRGLLLALGLDRQ